MRTYCALPLFLLLMLAFGRASAQQASAETTTVNSAPLKGLLPLAVQQSGIQCYYQYEAALEAAAKARKPLMLYFTAVNNAIGRSMEQKVWTNPEVLKLLKDDFIVALLYCDYNDTLPGEQQYRSRVIKKQVITVGDRNQDIEATYFDAEAQPFYIFIDSKNHKIAPQGYAYNPDPQAFVRYLSMVKAQFKKTRP